MDKVIISGIGVELLNVIKGDKGNVYHAIKSSLGTSVCFGEVYFSSIYHNHIKGWKKHTKMTLTLIVIKGRVKFYVYDDRSDSPSIGAMNEFILSPQREEYYKLIIPPHLWVAFEGIASEESILVNFADIPHTPEEALNSPIVDNQIHKPAYK